MARFVGRTRDWLKAVKDSRAKWKASWYSTFFHEFRTSENTLTDDIYHCPMCILAGHQKEKEDRTSPCNNCLCVIYSIYAWVSQRRG